MEEEAYDKEIMRRRTHGSLGSAPKYMAEHTVSGDETLSHISLKYYGSAAKDKWMIIYEANKDVIGDNPNTIRAGQVLKIPELPK
jgi:nucleoid-associated protein YgaU